MQIMTDYARIDMVRLVWMAGCETRSYSEEQEFPSPQLACGVADTDITLQPLVAQSTHVQQTAPKMCVIIML